MGRELLVRGMALGLAAVAVVGHLGPGPGEARADTPAGDARVVSGCTVKGNAPLKKGTQLFDTPSGARVIATFTGALVPMTLSEIPSSPTQGRTRLRTSNGSPALRLDGYLPTADVPVYTTKEIQAVTGHVWISSGQKVKLVSGGADTLQAELTIAGSEGQTVRGAAPCDAFSLQRGTVSPMEIPGNARGYLMKRSSVELYDQPNGNAVFTLKMMEGTAQLFWSTETRGGFVHIISRSDVTIDAWARSRDLDPLKKGEMRDQYIPPTTEVAGAQLALEKPPPLVKATKDIPIRARRDDKEKPIGVLEAGAEVYLMETVAGWTNVLPKSLGLTPPDEGGFWIPSSEAPR